MSGVSYRCVYILPLTFPRLNLGTETRDINGRDRMSRLNDTLLNECLISKTGSIVHTRFGQRKMHHLPRERPQRMSSTLRPIAEPGLYECLVQHGWAHGLLSVSSRQRRSKLTCSTEPPVKGNALPDQRPLLHALVTIQQTRFQNPVGKRNDGLTRDCRTDGNPWLTRQTVKALDYLSQRTQPGGPRVSCVYMLG